MQAAKIILLCILAAVTYGILHDQVTARVCVEYFTIGHPPVFNTDSPTLLALGWAIIATWWVGLPLGILAAIACRAGPWPKTDAKVLLRPLCTLTVAMGIISLLAGLAGYHIAEAGLVWLLEPLQSRIPEPKRSAFIADLWAHVAGYAGGFLGGVADCIRVLVGRR